MPEWKGHRFQIQTKAGEILAESRYAKMLLLLWHNRKDKENTVFVDTALKKIFPAEMLEKAYRQIIFPALLSESVVS